MGRQVGGRTDGRTNGRTDGHVHGACLLTGANNCVWRNVCFGKKSFYYFRRPGTATFYSIGIADVIFGLSRVYQFSVVRHLCTDVCADMPRARCTTLSESSRSGGHFEYRAHLCPRNMHAVGDADCPSLSTRASLYPIGIAPQHVQCPAWACRYSF